MSVCMVQVHVHIYRLNTIYHNMVISLKTLYGGCTSYIHSNNCDTHHALLFKIASNPDKEDAAFTQYNSEDLVYIISPLTSQLHTTSRKIMITYVGPVLIYKITDPHNYLLITLDGIILMGLFEYERLKLAMLRVNEGNVNNFS